VVKQNKNKNKNITKIFLEDRPEDAFVVKLNGKRTYMTWSGAYVGAVLCGKNLYNIAKQIVQEFEIKKGEKQQNYIDG